MYPNDHPTPESVARFGRTPLRAYGHAVVRIVGAVLLTAALWGGVVLERHWIALLRRGSRWNYRPVLSDLWGTEVSGYVLRDTALFAVSRLASPLVWGPLVAAGLLTVAVEYHRRGRSARYSVQG